MDATLTTSQNCTKGKKGKYMLASNCFIVGQKIRAFFIVLIVCASYIFVNKINPKIM